MPFRVQHASLTQDALVPPRSSLRLLGSSSWLSRNTHAGGLRKSCRSHRCKHRMAASLLIPTLPQLRFNGLTLWAV
jgi:hypothetical protein